MKTLNSLLHTIHQSLRFAGQYSNVSVLGNEKPANDIGAGSGS